MCKIMIVPGIKPEKTDELFEFAQVAAVKLSEADPHGFGYAAYSQKVQDETGNGLFGERWLSNGDAFNTLKSEDPVEVLLKKLSGHNVKNPPAFYSSFGNLAGRRSVNSLMLHSRYATCAKNIQNTHPFINKDANLALIHNGVILSATAKQMPTSTCDSEAILTEYQNYDVRGDLENIKWAVEELTGWYAVGVLSSMKGPGSPGKAYLDIFKETQASLYVGWVPELEAAVYCTSAQILYDTATEVGMTVVGIRAVFSDTAIRIDAVTGEVMGSQDFRHNSLTKTTYKESSQGWSDWEGALEGAYDRADLPGWSEVRDSYLEGSTARLANGYDPDFDVDDPEAYISRGGKVPHEASEGPEEVGEDEMQIQRQIERLIRTDEEVGETEADEEFQAQVLKLAQKHIK